MSSRLRHGFRPVSVLLISLLFVIFGDIRSDDPNPYRGQPRITTKDGHIILEAASDRDIVFKSSGRGSVKVNGDDLARLVTSSASSVEQGVVANLTARIAVLEQTATPSPSSTMDQEMMRKLSIILGTGANILEPQTIREAILKVNQLEEQVARLTQLVSALSCNGSSCGPRPLPSGGSGICGGLFTSEVGVIKSPFYPDQYPASITCNYTIRVPVGKIISMEFQGFHIEASENCIYDYLMVDESRAPLQSVISTEFFNFFNQSANSTNRLCGRHIPLPILTQYNELHLQFKTDGTVHHSGFFANYSAIDLGCGGVMTELTGSFASPNYPNSYPAMSKCNWLIRAPVGLIIRLTFSVFNLETHAKCNFDYIQVLDSDRSSLGKFCGNRAPASVQSTSNEMLVIFRADDSRSNDGFAASYVFVNESSSCGEINLFGETGFIRSPGFPRFYPPLKDCVWVVNSQDGHQIRFNVTSFDMENHTNCDYDFLELRNGGEATSPLFGKFCGTNIPNQWVSHSNKFYLRFKTDAVMTGTGFEVLFDSASVGCGGSLTSPTGLIESPNYPQSYGNNAECTWLITVSSGSSISLIFLEMDIEAHISCNYDYLELFDGNSEKSPSLGRYCHRQNPGTVSSKTNKLFIKFRSDTSQSGRGFRLSYTTNCTTTVSGYTGVIESPNFPNPYPSNIHCNWTIKTPIGNNITFELNHFQLENGSVCQNDYLEVLERKASRIGPPYEFQRLKKFCGQMSQPPVPFNSSSNMAKVSFYADTFLAYKGFRLIWRANGCGGEYINQQSGTITSPGYPDGYPSAMGCLWHIRAEPQQVITLTIVELDMELAINCFFDYLKIYSGPDDNAPELITTCHRIAKPVTVTSSANEMTLKLFTDRSVNGRGFLANFFIESGGCSFVSANVEKGIITSPNYPASYSGPVDCIWNLTVTPLHAIELTIQDLNIQSGVNCNVTFLSIYDGTERDKGNEIQRFCGSSGFLLFPFVTKTNNALVVLRDGGNSPSRGFKISYKAICGGTILVGATTGSTFTSPNYPHGSVVIQNCNWTFIAENMGDKIIITFEQMFGLATDPLACTGNNRITVRDGNDAESPVVATLCTNMIPKPIVSSGRTLQVQMIGSTVFKARYSSSTGSCGGQLSSDYGYFVSPGYPLGYPNNSECVWEIVAPEGNRVSFSIVDLMLQMTPACSGDFLQLRDMNSVGPVIGVYCGNQVPVLMNNVTTGNKLWIKFKSVAGSPTGGFEGQFQMVFGGDLSTDFGSIESPGFSTGLYVHSGPVRWTITTSIGTRMRINFVVMDLVSNLRGDCTRHIKILDGLSDSSNELGSFCGLVLPTPVTTSSNTATIIMNQNPQESIRGKFKLSWAVIS